MAKIIKDLINGPEVSTGDGSSWSPTLKKIVKAIRGRNRLAFISAENPSGKTLSKSENFKRTKELVSKISPHDFEFVHGFWREPEQTGSDPLVPEISLCVFGPDIRQALELGAKYGQHSVIVTDFKGTRLVSCHEESYGNVIMKFSDIYFSYDDFQGPYSRVIHSGAMDWCRFHMDVRDAKIPKILVEGKWVNHEGIKVSI